MERTLSFALSLVLIVCLLSLGAPAIAGPSSDDPDRPANQRHERHERDERKAKAPMKDRVAGWFERAQDKLGMERNCQISQINGVPYCTTDKSYDCSVLSEGAFDRDGNWRWFTVQGEHAAHIATPKEAAPPAPAQTPAQRAPIKRTAAPKKAAAPKKPEMTVKEVPRSLPPERRDRTEQSR